MNLKNKTFISMLRGINVSGQKDIRMTELQSLYESLNFSDVRTYVQSGNVIFGSKEGDASKLTGMVESKIKKSFGYQVSVLIKEPKYFKKIIENCPFLTKRNEDISSLYVTFLYGRPSKLSISSLNVTNNSGDEFNLGDEEIFIFCPNGYGRTKLNNNFFERKLKMPATTRNWKTVISLYKMATGEL